MSTDELVSKWVIAHKVLPPDLANRVLHEAGFRAVPFNEAAAGVMIYNTIMDSSLVRSVHILGRTVEKCDGVVRMANHTVDHGIVVNFPQPWLYVLPRTYYIKSELQQHAFRAGHTHYILNLKDDVQVNQIISSQDLIKQCALARGCPFCRFKVTMAMVGGDIYIR